MKTSKTDTNIVEALVNSDYSTWIVALRKVAQLEGGPVAFHNGVWRVRERATVIRTYASALFDEDLERLRNVTVDILREVDPAFDMAPGQRYLAGSRGNELSVSTELREGLAEMLAILAVNSESLKNCSSHSVESFAPIAVRAILENAEWELWGSVDPVMPFLAEAAPQQFLEAVNAGIQSNATPFQQLFAQESVGITGTNYLTGLLWALESLAWIDDSFIQVCVVLADLASIDPGGNYANRPIESLTNILLPWHPQNRSSWEKQALALQTIVREVPQVGWSLILRLLPSETRVAMNTRKPKWREPLPERNEVEVTHEEYRQQVEKFSMMAVDQASQSPEKTLDLVRRLGSLSPAAVERLLEALANSQVTLDAESRYSAWEELSDALALHRRHSTAKWVFDEETLSKVEAIVSKFAPHNPQLQSRRLFQRDEYELFEEEGNYQEQLKQLEQNRVAAVKQILEGEGFEKIIDFASTVELPWRVGWILAGLVGDQSDERTLPALVLEESDSGMQLAGGFIEARFNANGWSWVEAVSLSDWKEKEQLRFLMWLPFCSRTWQLVATVLGERQCVYWTQVNFSPFQVADDVRTAIEHFLDCDRPQAAVLCVYSKLEGDQRVEVALVVRALRELASTPGAGRRVDSWRVTKIIESLQGDSDVPQEALIEIELAYLDLLDGYHGATCKTLQGLLADSPEAYCEIIRTIFRSRDPEKRVEREFSEEERARASQFYKLLMSWRVIPGSSSEGAFSGPGFQEWYQEVKRLCGQSGHLEVAQHQFGQVLMHAPSDPDGLWIHRSVAETLNGREEEELRSGFRIGIYNSRGVHWVDPTGKPEFELAESYRQKAKVTEEAGYHRLATTLREIAETYSKEGKEVVENAEREEDIE